MNVNIMPVIVGTLGYVPKPLVELDILDKNYGIKGICKSDPVFSGNYQAADVNGKKA